MEGRRTLTINLTLQAGGEMAGGCGRIVPGLPVELEEVTKLREEGLARVST